LSSESQWYTRAPRDSIRNLSAQASRSKEGRHCDSESNEKR
jgi:hypothetical protein